MPGALVLHADDNNDLELSEAQVEQIAAYEVARQQRVLALTLSLLEKRQRAVSHRQQTGIEDEWGECDDAYEGIDDANRTTETAVTGRLQKPRTSEGGRIVAGRATRSGTRSIALLNITRPYTDAASARVADMLLPTDDRNFSIDPTPIPDMPDIDASGELPPEEVKAFLAQLQADAKTRADNAQTQIDDWLTECQYHDEVRKVIEDCSRLGTGILKGPTPVRRKRKKVVRQQGQMAMVAEQVIAPASRAISPWNFFPDPSCGDNVHHGSFVWERDRISARQVREFIGQPGYVEEALRDCLKEGPDSRSVVDFEQRPVSEDDSYEVWYFSGEITELDYQMLYRRDHTGRDAVKVVATVINERIVKIAREPLDIEGFSYDVMVWQRRSNLWCGIGIAKQISVCQKMLTAGVRNMSDNAALASGPQLVMTRGVLQPADGVLELIARKIWFADPEASLEDIRKAFMAIDIPLHLDKLLALIQFSLKMAEDVTGLPMLMQGNQGDAPDTVGGMQILNQNANVVLRRIARTFDGSITEPHIRRYYEWIMQYGKPNQQGDHQIKARGSTSLVERDLQRQAILAMGEAVLQPAYGLDPELWAEEALRVNRIDAARLKLSPEKRDQQQKALEAQQQREQAMIQQQLELEHLKLQNARAIASEKNQVTLLTNQQDNVTDMAVARERQRAKADAEPRTGGMSGW
jgi:hypothetical protein